MGLPGMGFTIASCNAYITMKGVMIPGVSAGSNHVGARVMCTPHVICPSGAAATGAGGKNATAKSSNVTSRPIVGRGRVMDGTSLDQDWELGRIGLPGRPCYEYCPGIRLAVKQSSEVYPFRDFRSPAGPRSVIEGRSRDVAYTDQRGDAMALLV